MWEILAVGVIAISRVVSSQSAPTNTSIPVTGVQAGIDPNTGARPPRLNIDDLYSRGGPQWYVALRSSGCSGRHASRYPDGHRDLYVLALAALQADSEDDELSYFQVSGTAG